MTTRTVRFTSLCVSILPKRVAHVLTVAAEKEMIRSDTARIVAVVADTQSFRHWTAVQLPRDPMC